ncbi:hypothetical protein GCM10009835_37410 [Planosporangium flavigriseum]|uniref:Uncharacterized protein n=1 Tax=Planosporangium flavigriseum TaxID=373681 RepID=A0A8J3PPM3_9ACTN|nr:hypothetical protein Pfl04_44570 [Planosporangium flavigriseum]
MGCSHTRECPLFPLLNASLRDWRNYYCDSAAGWRDCARYKLSTTGQLVPITLLPNGHDALHLRGIPSADGSVPARPRPVPQPRSEPGLPWVNAARFESAPPPEPALRPARGFDPVPPAQVPPQVPHPVPHPVSHPISHPVSRPVSHPVSPQVPHHSGIPSVRPAPPRQRRWWTRLADWIAGPA